LLEYFGLETGVRVDLFKHFDVGAGAKSENMIPLVFDLQHMALLTCCAS